MLRPLLLRMCSSPVTQSAPSTEAGVPSGFRGLEIPSLERSSSPTPRSIGRVRGRPSGPLGDGHVRHLSHVGDEVLSARSPGHVSAQFGNAPLPRLQGRAKGGFSAVPAGILDIGFYSTTELFTRGRRASGSPHQAAILDSFERTYLAGSPDPFREAAPPEYVKNRGERGVSEIN